MAETRVERIVDDIIALSRLCFGSVAEALDHIGAVYPCLTLEPRPQFLLEATLRVVACCGFRWAGNGSQ